MKQVVLFFLLLLIGGCSVFTQVSRGLVVGSYEFTDKISFYSSVQLKADSTFEVNSGAGLYSSFSNGTWSVARGHIVLNSFYQPTSNGYEITEGINSVSDSICIKVVDLNGEALPFTRVKLVKDECSLIETLNFDSQIRFLKDRYDSIYIRPSFSNEVSISINELEYNRITLKLIQGLTHYQYLSNEKWLFKNNRLYNTSFKKNKFQKENYYKRTKTLTPIISI